MKKQIFLHREWGQRRADYEQKMVSIWLYRAQGKINKEKKRALMEKHASLDIKQCQRRAVEQHKKTAVG